ncbi:defensin-like protein 1 [Tripterygium wilfordii]|uniref:defensin-like protein 1 n=1 Tax=Tripterygium wilfordii TaxID=458696 RepID=UPI0018F80320|nr:defensin-like protein 1 [Tripterygium wilfordii]
MKRSIGFLFLVLIFLASQEMMMPTEARVCASKSHYYKGPCLHNHNCAMVCRNEGFSGGKCHGLGRRCFCTKLC